MSNGKQKLRSVQEVADYLDMHPETIRQMARDGRLPSIKVSNLWRFRSEEIEAWLRQREVTV